MLKYQNIKTFLQKDYVKNPSGKGFLINKV